MKNRIQKWMKYNWAMVCMIVAVLLLIVSGSLAAYTNFNRIKRVVSTDGSKYESRFSSNHLSLVNVTESNYITKRITPSEIKEGDNVSGYQFTVQICNYLFGNPSIYNFDNITYTLKIKLIAGDGASLPGEVEQIKIGDQYVAQNGILEIAGQSLTGGAANMNSYIFNVPAALKDKVKFQIVAEPDETCQNATNGQKLAGVISLSELALTENWTGKFIDDQNINAEQYDAFNYEITGNGEGTVTLIWPSYLQISPWFLEDVQAVLGEDNNSCSFLVGGEVKDDKGNMIMRPTAYQFQFFRKPGTGRTGWSEMNSGVTVNFTKKNS